MPGITDKRLAEDEGVDVPRPLERFGDFPVKEVDLLCSGVMVGVESCPCVCLAGGWSDLAFAARAAARRAPSVAGFVVVIMLVRPKFPISDMFGVEVLTARLGRRLCEARAAKSDSITPGPMDLRGALVELLPDMGGY
jgi:hypothetical protein